MVNIACEFIGAGPLANFMANNSPLSTFPSKRGGSSSVVQSARSDADFLLQCRTGIIALVVRGTFTHIVANLVAHNFDRTHCSALLRLYGLSGKCLGDAGVF